MYNMAWSEHSGQGNALHMDKNKEYRESFKEGYCSGVIFMDKVCKKIQVICPHLITNN
jgi:hypothetical protein